MWRFLAPHRASSSATAAAAAASRAAQAATAAATVSTAVQRPASALRAAAPVARLCPTGVRRPSTAACAPASSTGASRACCPWPHTAATATATGRRGFASKSSDRDAQDALRTPVHVDDDDVDFVSPPTHKNWRPPPPSPHSSAAATAAASSSAASAAGDREDGSSQGPGFPSRWKPHLPPPAELDDILDGSELTGEEAEFQDALQAPAPPAKKAQTQRPRYVKRAPEEDRWSSPKNLSSSSPYATPHYPNIPPSAGSDAGDMNFNSFAPSSTFVSAHARLTDPTQVLKYVGERKKLIYTTQGNRITIRDCPFCNNIRGRSDNQFKLTVWLDSGSFNCLRCGSKGSWFDFKKRLGDIPGVTNVMGSRVDTSHAYAGSSTGSDTGVALSGGKSSAAAAAAANKPPPPLPSQDVVHNYPSNLFTQDKFRDVLDYLLHVRGLTRRTLQFYQIGACVHKFPNHAASKSTQAGMPPAPVVFEEQMCITMPWIKTRAQIDALNKQMDEAKGSKAAAAKDAAAVEKEREKEVRAKKKAAKARGIAGHTIPSPQAPVSIDLHADRSTSVPLVDSATTALSSSAAFSKRPPGLAPSSDTFVPVDYSAQVTERIKLRSLTAKGNQRLQPVGGLWNFFGWHTVPDDADTLVLTEGEFDAMAVWQATGLPTVSLPNGARSLPVELLPLLERFTRIYLWLDDDAAGSEGADKFARKLGVGRCLIVKSSLPERKRDELEEQEESRQRQETIMLKALAAGKDPVEAAAEAETTSAAEFAAAAGTKKPKPKDANDALRQGVDLNALVASAEPVRHEQILQFRDLREDVLREFTDPVARRGVQSRYLPGLNRILKGHRPGELTIITGATGVGKCWGKGTRMLLANGRTMPVEDIVAAMQRGEKIVLMGDDGTPRYPVPGTQTIGNTKEDSMRSSYTERAAPAVPATYKITSHNAARDSWTCNNHHILVLSFNQRPTEVQRKQEHANDDSHSHTYYYSVLGVVNVPGSHAVQQADGVWSGGSVQSINRRFRTLAEAEADRRAAVTHWQPLVWQCTVDEFLRCAPNVQRLATMFQPTDVQFKQDGKPLQVRLREALLAVHGDNINCVQLEQMTAPSAVERTAWVLGLWLTSGGNSTPAAQVQSAAHGCTARLREWYDSVMLPGSGRPLAASLALMADDCGSSTANGTVLGIELGPVLEQLLSSYNLCGTKTFPHDLLCEPKRVRMALLAGIIDGTTRTFERDVYEVMSDNPQIVDGAVHLARSLGFSTGAMIQQRCPQTDNGNVYCIHIRGGELHSLPTALPLKQLLPTDLEAVDDLRCDGFAIDRIAHADYFGFMLTSTWGTVTGNGRCLLADFVVTHNTTVLSQISLDYCSQGVNTLWGSFEIRNTKLARTMISQYANMNFSTEIPATPPPADTAATTNTVDVDSPHVAGSGGMEQLSEPLVAQPLASPPPDPAVLASFHQWADRFEQLPLYFMKFFGSNSVESVLDAMEYAVYVYDVEHILLDNLQFMLSEQGRGFDKFDLQDRAISLFREFASSHNVHISLVIHPRKENDEQALTVSSIFGGAKATQEADNILILQKPATKEDDAQLLLSPDRLVREAAEKRMEARAAGVTGMLDFRRIEVKKNRFDGELGVIPFKYDKKTCRIYEVYPGSGEKEHKKSGGGYGGGGGSGGRGVMPLAPRTPPRSHAALYAGGQREEHAEAVANANAKAAASMHPQKPTPAAYAHTQPPAPAVNGYAAPPSSPAVAVAPSTLAAAPPVKKRATRKKPTSPPVALPSEGTPAAASPEEDAPPSAESTHPSTVPPTKKKKSVRKTVAAGAAPPTLLAAPVELVAE